MINKFYWKYVPSYTRVVIVSQRLFVLGCLIQLSYILATHHIFHEFFILFI